MDVYHKVLIKLYEITGGRDTADVDLADLLKKEGFYPSIDSISEYMSSESWVAETSRKHVIRITHWGVAEAKKALSNKPDMGKELEKYAAKLVLRTKEMLVMTEEFASSPDAAKAATIEKQYAAIGDDLKKIKDAI